MLGREQHGRVFPGPVVGAQLVQRRLALGRAHRGHQGVAGGLLDRLQLLDFRLLNYWLRLGLRGGLTGQLLHIEHGQVFHLAVKPLAVVSTGQPAHQVEHLQPIGAVGNQRSKPAGVRVLADDEHPLAGDK